MTMEQRKPNYARRIFWLGLFTLLVVAGYSAGWYYVANRIETQSRAALAELNAGGVSAECANPTARGYPFRVGLYCDRIAFADGEERVALSAGSFRSAGQIYDLRRFVAELDGPASIKIGDGPALDFGWQALRGSVRLAAPLPDRISIEARRLTAGYASGARLGDVEAFEAHLRPNGKDLDLAVSFAGLSLGAELTDGRTLPPLSSRSDLSVTDGVSMLSEGGATMRGQSGTIRGLSLTSGSDDKTGMTLAGPFSVGRDGLIDAQFQVTIRDPKGLSNLLAEAFPEARDRIVTSLSGLAALGEEPSLPLRIVRGQAVLGFLPLGSIPPV